MHVNNKKITITKKLRYNEKGGTMRKNRPIPVAKQTTTQ
jgi:hypothetical protein